MLPRVKNKPITAILLSWKRPWNLPEIIQSLHVYDFIKEIIVWNNGDRLKLDGAKVINSPVNVYTYGRFLAAQHARHETIYTQDDDVIVHNVEALLWRFMGHQECITAGLSGGHYAAEAGRTPWLQIGWGAFWLKDWACQLDKYISEYGEDEVLYRKADRIFTALHGKHDPTPGSFTRLKNPNGKPSDRDPNSLWLKSDHRQLTMEAMARVRNINERKAPSSTVEAEPVG